MQKYFHRPSSILTAILVLSVILRLAAALYFGNQVIELPGTADQVSYHALAQRLLGGYGFSFAQDWWPVTPAGAPTAHWSFLYTFYLAGVYALFGPHPLVARVLQVVAVGLLQPYLVYRIGEKLFSRTVGLAAAASVAVYGYFIYYAATLMTEPFFITAILGSLFFAFRMVENLSQREGWSLKTALGDGLALGLCLAAAVLLRQLILLLVLVLFAWILFVTYRRSTPLKALPGLAVAGAVIVLYILPFTYYNVSRFGHFVLLNTNAGYAFYLANHPVYGTKFEGILSTESYNALIPQDLRHLDEAELDSALMKKGLQYVVENPGTYLMLSLSRIPVYFMFWPSSESGVVSNISRVVSFGLFWPFMLGGLVLSFMRRSGRLLDNLRSPVFFLFLFSLIYTLIHLLSWSLIRYRLPVDMIMLLFAGQSFVAIAQSRWLSSSRWSGHKRPL